MVNALFTFIIGFLLAVVVISIFYYSAQINQNASTLYRQTICAGIL